MTPTRNQLLAELQELAVDLGRAPFPDEIEEKGSFTLPEYRAEFGSWAHALAMADLEQPTGKRIPQGALIAELKRLAAELGKGPTEQDMYEKGRHGLSTYKNRFGSWNEALAAADLESRPDRTEKPRHILLNEIERIADDLGHTPTKREMSTYGEFSPVTYRHRFGSWNEAVEAAGFESQPPKEKIPEEELINELQRVADMNDGVPTSTDMDRDGKFSAGTYFNRFDSWTAALETAGFAPNRES
ncbi:homing endonuclease associated repeat-containing protein [Halapricum desulfuricans]|uniref:HNH family endonuclease n=1 Tax=Halapricum desulfuricans TaxID=2841257 RepID=A0A897MXX0_9EURY|nr:hypothetical protein [Halapricum desulfuricans]QSG05304.1 HNH family endonuclease [Halapricum desulfuricans]